MKVTDVKQQVKRQDRYSIYIDGKYVFSLSEAELLNSGLKKGREYSQAELEQLKTIAVIDKGYDRALNLLSHRPRSEWELRGYLKRKDYDAETTELIIDRLRSRGYVNDEDFARRWVENRRLLKATSRRRLIQELRQMRVPDGAITTALAADETDEREVLRALIEQKRRQAKYQDNLKLMQYLTRQGFSYDSVKDVVQDTN